MEPHGDTHCYCFLRVAVKDKTRGDETNSLAERAILNTSIGSVGRRWLI